MTSLKVDDHTARGLWNSSGRRATKELFIVSKVNNSDAMGSSKRKHHQNGSFRNTILESVGAETRIWDGDTRKRPRLDAVPLDVVEVDPTFDINTSGVEDFMRMYSYASTSKKTRDDMTAYLTNAILCFRDLDLIT
jgi:hypothetical protein